MKALVLKEYNTFSYEDVPDLSPSADELLVRVKACSICGSDIHGMDGSSGRRIPPVIMGHEAAGAVAALGSGVKGWREGDPVTFDSMIYCGTCHFCRNGRTNLCDNRKVLGVSCDEYNRQGAFAEYVVVPQHIVFRLPEGMAFEHGALIEPLSVAVHAVSLAGKVLNKTAVVVGCGTIGLLITQVLRAAGCSTIIGVDIEDDRLDLARSLGASNVMHPDQEEFHEAILESTCGRGADISFEAVGATSAVRTGVACLRKGGTMVLVGNLAPDVEFPAQAVVTREIAVFGSCAQTGDYPACIDMVDKKRVNVGALISTKAPLSEGADWFRRLYGKERGLLKVVLEP